MHQLGFELLEFLQVGTVGHLFRRRCRGLAVGLLYRQIRVYRFPDFGFLLLLVFLAFLAH